MVGWGGPFFIGREHPVTLEEWVLKLHRLAGEVRAFDGVTFDPWNPKEEEAQVIMAMLQEVNRAANALGSAIDLWERKETL